MKQFFLLAAVALTSMTASAQFGAQRGNPVVPSVKAEVEDFKPAISNQENKQFPAVNSMRQVRAHHLQAQPTSGTPGVAASISLHS